MKGFAPDTTATTAGPGHTPPRPQPMPKSTAPPTSFASMAPRLREVKARVGQRRAALQDGAGEGEVHGDGADHHKCEARVPVGGDVEKPVHLCRLRHAREAEAERKREPREEGGEGPHRTPPKKRPTSVAVIMPAAMNVSTATRGRSDGRTSPAHAVTADAPAAEASPMSAPPSRAGTRSELGHRPTLAFAARPCFGGAENDEGEHEGDDVIDDPQQQQR